jgi:hypothetical protein
VSQAGRPFHLVFEALVRHGLLLESDPRLPSVASLVAGEPVKGSWWSHPSGQAIFVVNEELGEHPDVLMLKLVSGKVTFVHRALWSPVVAVVSAGAPWQMEGLSAHARRLLDAVRKRSELRADEWRTTLAPTEVTRAARELDSRLLVQATQVHTERGSHARWLRTWPRWCRDREWDPGTLTPDAGRLALERVIDALNRESGGKGSVPWRAGRKK